MPEEKVSQRYPMGRCCEGGTDGKKHTDTCEFTEHGTRKPAADAGPRQCAECGHGESAHFSAPMGSFCKRCPAEDNVWEHVFRAAPPVPQEAAPRYIHSIECEANSFSFSPADRRCSCNSDREATAPDSAMRVASEIHQKCVMEAPDELWMDIPKAAALIREAGSERERALETALRNLRDRLQIIMAWPDEHWSKHLPIEIESELAEASRLLGRE